MVERQAPAPVEREAIAVMGLQVEDEPAAMRRGWETLEAAISTLRGRRCYGAFDPASGAYLVCVQRRADDDVAALGLEPARLPGGRYLRLRLRGEASEIYAMIAASFESLQQLAEPDPARPLLEYYRRHGEVDLLLPVSPPPPPGCAASARP